MTFPPCQRLVLLVCSYIILFNFPCCEGFRRVDNNDIDSRNNNDNNTRKRRKLKQQHAQQVTVKTPDTPDAHLVTNLPLLKDFSTLHWAGLLPASNDGTKYLFYWLFAPDDDSTAKPDDEKDIPLVIWLNGGPACSSMDGLFIENGPFRFATDDKGQYVLRPDANSWHKLPAYTLYIDQPVGTGLSFTTNEKYPKNDEELSVDFYSFLQQFLRLHADKFVTGQSMNRPLYFSGESYAGHYNAIYPNYILKMNAQLLAAGTTTTNNVHVRVAGSAIGNGWFDPYHQYNPAQTAYGHGLIGASELAALNHHERQCQAKLKPGHYYQNVCLELMDVIVDQSHGSTGGSKVSSYDVRRTETTSGGRSFPPGHKLVETYLGAAALPRGATGTFPAGITDQALQALHAVASQRAGQVYRECTDPPYFALQKLDGQGCVQHVVEILEHEDNVEMLFFNGIYDLVCAHSGNEEALDKLPWKYNETWKTQSRYAWRSNNKVAGYMREYKNLKFLKVLDAGHMVPLDVPEVAFDMMQTFLYHGSFKDAVQKLDRSAAAICPSSGSFQQNVAQEPQSSSPILAWVVGFSLVAVVVFFLRGKRRTRSYDDVVDGELGGGQYSDDTDDFELK